MPTEQLIFIADHHEVADQFNSEIPDWPVQDMGGRWHHQQFDGQRVAYTPRSVEFGFLARRMSANEVARLDMDDLPSHVYWCAQHLYTTD
jgi:hypothetical protein